MIKKIEFWLNCSRVYSLPMTVLSWLVVFLFAAIDDGNILLGVLALFGILLGQMATNLFDDYLDYKAIKENPEKIKNIHKNKCKFLVDKTVSLEETLKVVIIYCILATIIGFIIFCFRGLPIIFLSLIGAIFILFYSKLSRIGLSEFAVGIAFGPLLFEGVYFVMTEQFSFEILLISIAVSAFTVGLLYTHTLMDFDMDTDSHKKTLACLMGSKNKALTLLTVILGVGYLTIFSAIISDIISPWFLITLLTLPLAFELYFSLKLYNENKSAVPDKGWWNYPMENMEQIKQDHIESFMFRFYQARNLMIYFSLLVCLAKIITVFIAD